MSNCSSGAIRRWIDASLDLGRAARSCSANSSHSFGLDGTDSLSRPFEGMGAVS